MNPPAGMSRIAFACVLGRGFPSAAEAQGFRSLGIFVSDSCVC